MLIRQTSVLRIRVRRLESPFESPSVHLQSLIPILILGPSLILRLKTALGFEEQLLLISEH